MPEFRKTVRRLCNGASVALRQVCVLGAAVAFYAGMPSEAQVALRHNPLVCISRMEIPGYPPIARQAAIQGSVTVHVYLSEGTVQRIDTYGKHKLLNDAVGKGLAGIKCDSSCRDTRISFVFDFRIIGEPTALPTVGSVTYVAPDTFQITVPPRSTEVN